MANRLLLSDACVRDHRITRPPDVEQRHWQWISPGAVIGIVLWLVVSFGFRVYLHFFNSYSATYGALGAVIILMLWFYVTGGRTSLAVK